MSKYQVQFGNTNFVPSPYQEAIFDNIEHGVGDMIIKAAAGSAKTTTLVNCINIIPKNKRILFLAFNKDIVTTIENKLGPTPNAKICTFHSLGRSIFCETNGYIAENQINEFKYKNYIEQNIEYLTNPQQLHAMGKARKIYLNNIISLIDFSRHALAFKEKEILKVAEKYGYGLVFDEPSVVRKALKWGKENLSTIDFTDMIWLPNALNMLTKKDLFDWILIDEAQDITIAQQQLVTKCYKRGCRVIAVGDENQRINIWAGSDEHAIETFKERYGETTKYFPLPISYRCPKKVVAIANEILAGIGKSKHEIITPDNAIDGIIRYDVSKFDPIDGDMVLCRITAPLISLHLQYLQNNKHSYVRGYEDIQRNYIDIITSTDATDIDKGLKNPNGLFVKLYDRLINIIKKNMDNYLLSYEDAVNSTNVITFYDAILAIEILSQGVDNTWQLLEKINDVFATQNTKGVQLSTIHKAKGLEADNVYILKYSLMPMKSATKEWEILSEENLRYVAVTRAIKSLNFIKDENFYKKNQDEISFDTREMLKKIEHVRLLLGYPPLDDDEVTDFEARKMIIEENPLLLEANSGKTHNKKITKKVNSFSF